MHFMLLSVAGLVCGCVSRGAVTATKWNADGQKIYLVEQRFLEGPFHPYEYFVLDLANPDLTNRQRITCGNIRPQSVSPSPDGEAVLFVDGNRLVIYNTKRSRRDAELTFDSPWPMSLGWLPNSREVYFTTDRGIETLSKSGARRVLVSGVHYGLGWSDDGRLLAYTTGNGWPAGNALRVLEVETGREWVAASKTSGIFDAALFSPDGRQLVLAVSLMEGHQLGVYVINQPGTEEALVWNGTGHVVGGIHWVVPGKTIVFANKAERSRISIRCAQTDGSYDAAIEGPAWSEYFSWDYDPPRHRLLFARDHTAAVRALTSCPR